MNPKEFVKSFYESDFYKSTDVLKSFLHPECELYWSSSSGFVKFDYDEMILQIYRNQFSRDEKLNNERDRLRKKYPINITERFE